MRKYFLFSAVALMISSTVNATTDYAEVTAKATIEVANKTSCDNIDFGNIVVKSNNEQFKIRSSKIDGNSNTGDDLISISGNGGFTCSTASFETATCEGICGVITLTNTNGDNITLEVDVDAAYDDHTDYVSTLTIPATVKAGEYTGSFTMTSIIADY